MRKSESGFAVLTICAAVAVLVVSNSASALLMWEGLAPFSDPRTGGGGIEGASAAIIGDTIYVAKGYRPGDTAYLSSYDIPTDTWTHGGAGLPDAAVPNSEGAGASAGGLLYAIGGRPGIASPGGPGDVVEEFTPGGGWVTMSSMPTPRRGLGTGSLGGLIYAAGGSDGGAPGSGTPLSAFEVFDPLAGVGGTWTSLASMPIALMDVEATIALGPAESGSLAGSVYVFGGFDPIGGYSSVLQIYDIASDVWSLGAPMPTARSNAMAGLIDMGVSEDGMIAVFGGYDGVSNLTTTEFYDPLTDSWTSGPAMLFAQSEHAVGPLSDATGIYAIGAGIFGAAGSAVERLVPIPEPTSSSLLAIGLVALSAWRSRSRRMA